MQKKGNLVLNKNERQREFSMLAFFLFLIAPIISLPFIVLSFYNREKFSLFILALFFGVLSFYIIPTWELDISRYYFIYENIRTLNFEGLKILLKDQDDYVLYLIYFLFSRFDLSFQFYMLIMSTFCFYSYFRVGDFVIRRFNPSRSAYFFLMGSFIFSLPILSMISVSRFSIASTFFILYLYYHLKKHNKKACFFIILSCLTHFSFIVYVPFLILFYFFNNRVKINLILLAVGGASIILSINGGLMQYIQYIPFLAIKAQTYLSLYEDTNIKILTLMMVSPIFIALFFYMRFYKFVPARILQVFLVVLLVALICLPTNMIIYDRFIQVFKPVFALTIMATYYSDKILNRDKVMLLKKIVLVVTFFYAMYYFYTFYIIYRESFRGFLSLGKILLVSILDSTYSQRDFY